MERGRIEHLEDIKNKNIHEKSWSFQLKRVPAPDVPIGLCLMRTEPPYETLRYLRLLVDG